MDGPSSPPLFVAASDACRLAWTKSQQDARKLAEDLLPLLARVAGLTDAEPAAADLAALLTEAAKWEVLVDDAIASAPAPLAAHLELVRHTFREKAVVGGSPCSDMSEDGPEGGDARKLSFSEGGAAPAVAVADARPGLEALSSPAAGGAAGGAATTGDAGFQ